MSNGTVVGNVQEVFRNESCVSFDWIINLLSIVPSKIDFWYFSHTIDVLDIKWYLGFQLVKAEKGLFQLTMFRKSKHSPKQVRFTLGKRNKDGTEQTIQCDQSFPDGTDFCTLDKHLPFEKLFEYYPFRSIITCTLRIEEPTPVERKTHVTRETQTETVSPNACSEDDAHFNGEDDSTLRKHLKDLLLTGDDHDVILKVKQKEFRAHKNMLRARSPVFAAMFKHKMKESTDGSISIEDCDPDAFGEFLNYVYTGRVEDVSPSKAMRLYYAADKYDFSGLKKICVKHLTESMSTTAICDVIALATNHGENDLLQCAISFFSKNAEKILTTVEWQRFGINNFVLANELYIKALKSVRGKVDD